jgi:MFS family permease
MTLDRYRAIFALPAFRRFWFAFTLSSLGDAMTRVALIWFVYDRTESARAVGWLLLCYTGPIVIGGLAAGALLDRFDRRLVMAVDNGIRGIVLAVVPVLHLLDRLLVWHIYAVAGVYGLLMMISLAGGPAIVPDLVSTDHLPAANALEMLSFTLSGVVGPPLAGLLINLIGAPNVVLFDTLSYGLLAITLISLPTRTRLYQSSDEQYTMRDALRLLRHNQVLFSTTLMFLCFNIGNGLVMVALPVLADRTLHGGAALYGLLLGMLAIGEVVSSMIAGGVQLRRSFGSAIALAQLCSGVALLPLALHSTLLALVALTAYGFCSAPLTIWAQTLRMRIIPERLRGRSFALLRTIMQSGGPLGGALGGMLIPLAGVTAVVLGAAAVIGLPGIAGGRFGNLRRDGEPSEPATGKYAQSRNRNGA